MSKDIRGDHKHLTHSDRIYIEIFIVPEFLLAQCLTFEMLNDDAGDESFRFHIITLTHID